MSKSKAKEQVEIITKKAVGRKQIIFDNMDRKTKYAASLTPRQHKKMTSLFTKNPSNSSFGQAI